MTKILFAKRRADKSALMDWLQLR